MLTKKFVAIATALTVSVMLVGPGVAQGATIEELNALIASLSAQLASLTAQLAALQTGGTGTVTGCTIASFAADLSQGTTGADVKCLQIILNSDADTQLAVSGVGSSGSETTYFGPLTKAAVVKFQNKYAAEILTPIGLTAGTGYVGPATRPKLDSLLAGGAVTPPTSTLPEGCTSTSGYSPTTGQSCATGATGGTPGENKVSLAADNPAATAVAIGAQNVIFSKINFCAAATANTVSKITVTRAGLAADADIASVKIYEGATQVGSTQAINTSNHKAVFASINWTIPANSCKVLTLKATLSTAATAGDLPRFQITSAADIVSTVAFDGVFPISSNGMTIAGISAGSIMVATTSPSGGSKIAGGVEQDVAGFKLTASSSEAVKIYSITLTSVGSIVAGDISNIKLWYNSVQIGSTVASLDSLNKAIFDLSASPLEITANNSKTLKVTVDIGSSIGINNRTISFEITDNTRVVAYGANSGGQLVAWGGTDWGTTDTWPQNTSAVTIVLGSLSVENSTAYSPSDQEYSRGTYQNLMVAFKFTAGANEGVRITQLKLKEVTTALNDSDVSNITLYDADTGTQLVDTAGNLVPAVGMIGGYATFGSYTTGLDTTGLFDIEATKYKNILVKCDISAASQTTTDILGFKLDNPSIDVKADGLSSLNDIAAASITPTTDIPATAISHDIIQYGTLTLQASVNTPSAATYALGSSDYTFAMFDLISTGEDILVSQLNVYFSTNTSAATTSADAAVTADINNARIYDGNTLLASDNAISSGFFDFALNLTVPKNTTKTVTVKANIPTGSTAPNLTAWVVGQGSVIAEGSASGQTIPAAGFGSAVRGSLMTKGVPGLVVIAANTPIAQTYIVNSPNALLASLSFTASTTEDVSVSKIRITAGATSSATVTSADDLFDGTTNGNVGAYLSNIAIYDGTGQIGNTVSALVRSGATGNTYYADFSSLSFIVPKGTTKVVDVYAKILAASTSVYFYAGIASSTSQVIGSGASSGQTATVKIGSGTDGTIGKGMVLGSSGYLAVSNDINRPISAMQVEGSTGVSFGAWKFTSANEPILISKLLFEVMNSVFATGSSVGYASADTSIDDIADARFNVSFNDGSTSTIALSINQLDQGVTAQTLSTLELTAAPHASVAAGALVTISSSGTDSTSTTYIVSAVESNSAQSTTTVIGMTAISDGDGYRIDSQSISATTSLGDCLVKSSTNDSNSDGLLSVLFVSALGGDPTCSDIAKGEVIRIGNSTSAIATAAGPISSTTALILIVQAGASVQVSDEIWEATTTDNQASANTLAYNAADTGDEIATWIASSTNLEASFSSSNDAYTVWASTSAGGYSIEITDNSDNASNTADDLKLGLKYGGTETVGKVAGTNANLVPGKVCLYDGTTQLACTSIGADAGGWLIFNFPSGAEIEIPYPGSKVLTLKADISNYLEASEGSTIQFAWGTTTADTAYYSTYILAKGKNSGTDLSANTVYNFLSATSLTAYASDLMYLYGTKPVVTLNSGSPSGAQLGGSNNTVFKFDVTNPNTGISANVNAIRFTLHGYAAASTTLFGRTFNLYKSTDPSTKIGTGISYANATLTDATGWVTIYPDPASEAGSNSTVTYVLKGDTSAMDTSQASNQSIYISIEDGDFYWDDSLVGNAKAKVLNLPVAGGVMTW